MSSRSLYMRIYRDISSKILQGGYVENEPLPSERFLCEYYHVSRSTIRQALDSLRMDNFIFKIHGKGTFVKPQVFEQPLRQFYSFTEELNRSNIFIRNQVVSYEEVALNVSLAALLKRDVGEFFHKIVRLRFVRDCPLMLETTYLPKNRFYRINRNALETGSMYNYLVSKYSLKVERATEMFRPVMAKSWQNELLNISSRTPCTLLERFSYEDDLLVEYTYSLVRGDKYVFRVDLTNGAESVSL